MANLKVEKLKDSVQEKFIELRKAIDFREKLLLRQIDVIASQSQSASAIDEIKFIPENEKDLLDCLRTFGKFNFDNINFTNDVFINEDYILPSIDHETMHKCLQNVASETNDNEAEIIVNFSNNKKLIKENVDNINESIIHITLNEARQLIEKTRTNLYHTTDESTNIDKKEQISQSSQTDGNKHHIKPKVTINNCNGTINLKNISNLTINCVTQDSFNIPDGDSSNKQSIESGTNSSHHTENEQRKPSSFNNYTSSSLSSSSTKTNQSSNINTTKDSENNSVNCEFYDRLISEIKNTIKQSQKAPIERIPLGRKAFNATFCGDKNEAGSSDSTTTTNDSYSRKLLLKNFENLKIVLENNENETHPVQIEQWLTEIISSVEVEPMQNIDILDCIHSNE